MRSEVTPTVQILCSEVTWAAQSCTVKSPQQHRSCVAKSPQQHRSCTTTTTTTCVSQDFACHCFYYHSRVYIAPPPSFIQGRGRGDVNTRMIITRAPRALTREALLFIWACAKVVSIRVCQNIILNITISKLLVLVSMSGLWFCVYINNISALV